MLIKMFNKYQDPDLIHWSLRRKVAKKPGPRFHCLMLAGKLQTKNSLFGVRKMWKKRTWVRIKFSDVGRKIAKNVDKISFSDVGRKVAPSCVGDGNTRKEALGRRPINSTNSPQKIIKSYKNLPSKRKSKKCQKNI